MNNDEKIHVLKAALNGGDVSVTRADENEVQFKVRQKYDPATRRLTLEVQLDALPGQFIENVATGISYKVAGGKGAAPTLHAARGWGVVEGPQIVAGIDINVPESGKFPGEYSIGTFVKVDGGYRMWMRTEKFDFDSSD